MRCLAGLCAAVLAVAVLALDGTTALAAEYEVWSCRGPDGTPISTAAWKYSEEQAVPGDVQFADSCPTAGHLDISVTGATIPVGRAPQARLDFQLPAGVTVRSYELWRYMDVATISAYRAGVTEQSQLGSDSFGCASILLPPAFSCTSVGDPSDPDEAANHFAHSGLELTGLSLWAQCNTTGCLVALPPPAALFRLYRSKVTLDDPLPPSPPLLSGSILDPGELSGKLNLMVEAEDAGSGIRSFAVSVDGGSTQILDARDPAGTCEAPFDRAQPCPLQTARLFEVDTAALAEGQHTLTGWVRDAAGNQRDFGPIAFRVGGRDQPPAPSGGGNAAPTNGSPSVTFPVLKIASRRVRHRHGAPVELRGKILTSTGQPVSGARLGVEMEINRLRSPRLRRLPDVRSKVDGSFRIPVPGEGHRTVTVSFSPAPGLPPTRVARADVVSSLGLTIGRRPARVRRGQVFTVAGRLQGGGETVEGANVEIQSIVSGKWRTVANVAARRGGSYRWKYRFRYVDRDAIFSFRAVVRRTPGWPWQTLRSRKVTVRIDVD